ncbi:MAG: hypothetical protein R3Y60_03390 [bacterium]
MFKKIITVVLLFIFSIVTVFFGFVVFLSDEINAYVSELLVEEEYDELYEALFYGSIVEEKASFLTELNDGTLVYMYKGIVDFTEVDEDGNIDSDIKEGIKLFFVNIGEDTNFANVGDIVVSNGSTEYIGEVKEEYAADVYYLAYNCYSIVIETESWNSYYTNSQFDTIAIYDTPEDDDDTREEIVSIDLNSCFVTSISSNVLFSTEQSSQWSTFITRANDYYNGLFEENYNGDDLDNALLEEYEEIYEIYVQALEDSSFRECSFAVTELTSNGSFMLKMIITIVAVVAVNGTIIYIVFIKKNRELSKMNSQQNNKKIINSK